MSEALTPLLRGRIFARVQQDQLALAPAAGSGIGKKLAELLLADGELPALMVAVVKNGLQATRSVWDHSAKCMVSEPDTRSQLQCLTLLLAHMEGEPVKRIIHQHIGTAGLDPVEALQDSPALRAAAERMLEKARWRESGRAAAKPAELAPAMDV